MKTDNRKGPRKAGTSASAGPIETAISVPGTAPAVATDQTIRELLEIEQARSALEREREQDQVVYEGFTRRQLTKAFNRVENKENWKFPIDAVVTIKHAQELTVIRAAVVFFTGGVANTSRSGNTCHITAPGYYNSVGP